MIKLKKKMQQIWLNADSIARRATRATSVIFAIVGFISTFSPLGELLDVTTPITQRILFSFALLVAFWLFCCLVFSVILICKNRYEVLAVNNGHHVYVQYGDLFSDRIAKRDSLRRNIVVPVNRCFDTIVDDDLISSNSLHGKMIRRILEAGIYDSATLDSTIHAQLERAVVDATLTREQKRKGNLRRYAVGTVAEIPCTSKITYFLLGLSSFDSELHAHTSDEEYALALLRLVKYCDTRSNGFPVIMPLIGAGASNTRKSESDILSYLLCLLKMNADLVNCDIHIVVRESGRNSIGISEICNRFLG